MSSAPAFPWTRHRSSDWDLTALSTRAGAASRTLRKARRLRRRRRRLFPLLNPPYMSVHPAQPWPWPSLLMPKCSQPEAFCVVGPKGFADKNVSIWGSEDRRLLVRGSRSGICAATQRSAQRAAPLHKGLLLSQVLAPQVRGPTKLSGAGVPKLSQEPKGLGLRAFPFKCSCSWGCTTHCRARSLESSRTAVKAVYISRLPVDVIAIDRSLSRI